MNPKVSIIIPNYNHAPFLNERLDSVFNQTFQDFEVILLDDCSVDTSIEILSKYANNSKVSHFIINKKNSGSPFKQWKKGIELAQGDYIWIAESDDYCELTFLELSVNCLLNGVDICFTQTYDVDELGTNLKSRLPYTSEFKSNIWQDDFKMEGNAFNSNYLLVKNVIPNASAVLFKRSIVKEVFFDKALLSMRMCGDWLFWIRLSAGKQLVFLSEHLNYFRSHNSISRKQDTIQKKKMRLKEEALLRAEAYLSFGIWHEQSQIFLYDKWFQLHRFPHVFTKSFYSIKLPQTSWKTLFLIFLKQKFKTCFKF